jgi:16S rRNA (guanine527-N7)-methyltransferase
VDVNFAEELDTVLPSDLPHRDVLIRKADHHLRLIVAANAHMNLTRITNPREAAIKHIYDCVAPWRHFEHARRIMDAGTGAGFPGIPLAIVFPRTRLCLSESIQKKARFVDHAVETLELPNVHVFPERAEAVAVTQKPDIITARAVAPISRILDLFDHVLRNGTRLLLYKGPDVEQELAEARKHRVHAAVLSQYELPHGMGARTLIELQRHQARATAHAASQIPAEPNPQ